MMSYLAEDKVKYPGAIVTFFPCPVCDRHLETRQAASAEN